MKSQEGKRRMGALLYGLIALYFVGVALLVLVIAYSPSSQPAQAKASPTRRPGGALVYVMCAAVFILLSLLAIVAERGRLQTGTHQS